MWKIYYFRPQTWTRSRKATYQINSSPRKYKYGKPQRDTTSSLNKNPDLDKFTDKDNSISFLINTPLTSVDVKNHSKSLKMSIRRREPDENLEKLLVISYNIASTF